MPLYRGTLLFEFQGPPPAGFSESFAFSTSTDVSAGSIVQQWPDRRKAFLSSSWSIIGYRVAKVESFLHPGVGGGAQFCAFKFTPVTIQACPAPVAGVLGVTDTPYTAALVDFFRDDNKHPRAYLARGIPDTWWANGTFKVPIPDETNFNAWFNYMHTVPGFGALDKGPNNLGPPKTFPTTCTLALHPYVDKCIKRIASRRIGRPFGLLRGRRTSSP